MAHRSPAYLSRNRYSYCLRIKVPDDVQRYVGKKELRWSLRTGYLGKAKSKARRLAGCIQQLFEELRGNNQSIMDLSDKQINELVIQHLEKIKAGNENPTAFDSADPPPFDNEIELANYLDTLEDVKADLRLEIAKGDFWRVKDDAKALLLNLMPAGETIDETSDAFLKLCEGLLRAEIKGVEHNKARLTGEYEDELEQSMIHALSPQIENPSPPSSLKHTTASQPESQVTFDIPQQTSSTMKIAGDAFWIEFNLDWKPRSRTDYKNAIEQIISGFGPDTQLNTIDYNRVKEFRDCLRDGTLSKYNKPLSISRVNFLVATVKRIFDLAMKRDKNLDRINPADGLQLKDKRKASEKRDVFSEEDLHRLFIDSREYGQNKHTKSANFWIPLLGLYTGARMEELCQLLIEDIVQRDGVWCIDIREDNAKRKSVKVGERRIVPLHPFLINDLRFPEYVKSIEPKRKRVFHELKYVNNRWGHGFGQWFGRFKKRAGIDAAAGKKSFHSFRHTLINQLKQNEADPQYVKEFVGHKLGKDITWDLYGKAFKPSTLMGKVVSKLDYPVDLSHLKTSKWVPKNLE